MLSADIADLDVPTIAAVNGLGTGTGSGTINSNHRKLILLGYSFAQVRYIIASWLSISNLTRTNFDGTGIKPNVYMPCNSAQIQSDVANGNGIYRPTL